MINFDAFTEEKIKEHNPIWPRIPDSSCRIIIIRGSESGTVNLLFNLISHQPDIDKTYLFGKGPYEAKHQF